MLSTTVNEFQNTSIAASLTNVASLARVGGARSSRHVVMVVAVVFCVRSAMMIFNMFIDGSLLESDEW